MTRKEVSIRIGGAAGDGVASTGEIFARTCSRSGLHVYAYNSYQSVIRGGHVWFQVRASAERVLSVGKTVDILIALNAQTVAVHLPEVVRGGVVVYDPARCKGVDASTFPEGVRALAMPLGEIAKKYSTNPILANTVALGAAMAMIGADFDRFANVVADTFGGKKQEVVDANLKAAREGFDHAGRELGRLDYELGWGDKRRVLLTGNQAIALGAMAAGCRFYSFYPMTPATSIGHYLAENGPAHGVVVKQAEDELAVINMAIGAGHAGARAMCGTSGGGFALMVEAMGLAGMTETPLVVALSQRSGPSTGLPTKTEQGDLNMMMGAGQGDYPRIILAPRNVEEAYYATVEAFNLAEKWQTPVILAVDLLLSEHFETIDDLRFDVPVERGPMWDPAEGPFLRYKVTESGVSPRAFPGQPDAQHVAGSDEHDEDSSLVSDVRAGLPEAIEVRVRQMDKRMRKLEGAARDLAGPELVGPQDAPVTLVYWGSTQGAAREALAALAAKGHKVNALEFKDVFPLPPEAAEALGRCRFSIFVEGNFTGQFQRHVRAETGYTGDDALRKYDGEPLWPEDIVAKVEDVLARAAPAPAAAAARGGR